MRELPQFTPAEITAGFTKTKRSSDSNKDYYYERDENGQLVRCYGRPTVGGVGVFFGKAGKTRKYDDVDVIAIAYKITPK